MGLAGQHRGRIFALSQKGPLDSAGLESEQKGWVGRWPRLVTSVLP